MKLKSICLIMCFAASCANPETPKESASRVASKSAEREGSDSGTVSKNAPDSVTIIKITAPEVPKKAFAETTYFITSHYDLTNCKAVAECDCCSSEVSFLNDSIFVYADYCEGSVKYFTGNYFFSKQIMTLVPDSLVVSEFSPFGDAEADSTQYGTFKAVQYVKPIEYYIERCDNKILLRFASEKYSEYGTVSGRPSELLAILNQRESTIREFLGLE